MFDMLRTDVGTLTLRNPILLASGIVGAGVEYADYIDHSKIGGIVTKTVTPEQKKGNSPPRIVEEGDSVLNSIGLQNPGIDRFIEEYADFLSQLDTAVIVSIGGSSIEELIYCAERVEALDFASAIELNLSCPNVKSGGMSFAMSPGGTAQAVSAVRKITEKPLWVKLTPQVADISEIGLIAQEAGADAIVAINTIPAFDIDLDRMQPSLGNGMGGLSGPGIFPIAMRSVYLLLKKLDIPVVAIGGINSTERALKFMALGAKAVQIGSALFRSPELPERIVAEMPKLIEGLGYSCLKHLTGVYKG